MEVGEASLESMDEPDFLFRTTFLTDVERGGAGGGFSSDCPVTPAVPLSELEDWDVRLMEPARSRGQVMPLSCDLLAMAGLTGRDVFPKWRRGRWCVGCCKYQNVTKNLRVDRDIQQLATAYLCVWVQGAGDAGRG